MRMNESELKMKMEIGNNEGPHENQLDILRGI